MQADFDLGRQIHLEYVPLIFVVGTAAGPAHAVEVTDLAQLGDVVAGLQNGQAQ